MQSERAVAALSCVLKHALDLELTMLEARPDAAKSWAVSVDVRSMEECGCFCYAHVFWSGALARSWTRQAAMEWARSRGESLDEPCPIQWVSQGEMGFNTFTAVELDIEPGVSTGCVAYLDLQTLFALAVVLRDRAVTESKIIELRTIKEFNVMYAVEVRKGLGLANGRHLYRVSRSLREANRVACEFCDSELAEEYFNLGSDPVERAERNECGGVVFDDLDQEEVVIEVRAVSAGQPLDPFGQMFDVHGEFVRPSLVPSERTRLSAAERREVARRAYADVKSKLADVDARLFELSEERSQPGRSSLVKEAFALEARRYELETVIANCDGALADAPEPAEIRLSALTIGT